MSSLTAQRTSRLWMFLLVAVLILVAARLSLTAIIAANPERALWPDSSTYLFLTERLLNGAGLHGDGSSFIDLQRTPGYPLFLASVFTLAGEESFALIVFLQLLFGVLIAMALYWLGQRLFNQRVGLAAALVYLLTPNAALWAMAILTDVPFALLLTLALVPAGLYFQEPKSWQMALAGTLLGCAALVRPITTLIIGLWAGLILLHGSIFNKNWKRALVHTAVFLAFTGAFVGGWILRNTLVWERPMLSSISTWNLGHYMAPAALARAEGISLEEARSLIPTTRIPQPGERERYLQILLKYPLDFLATHFRGVRITFTEAGRPNYAHFLGVSSIASGVVSAVKQLDFQMASRRFFEAFSDPALRFVYPALMWSLSLQLLTYVFSIVGVFRLVRSRKPVYVWSAALLTFTAALLLFSPGVVGNSRFRIPAEPILALLMAAGLYCPFRDDKITTS